MKTKKEVKAVKTEQVQQQPTAQPPTATEIDACMKLVEEAVKYFDRGGPAMTAEDRRRTVKVRKGGEKYIPKLARAAVASGVTPSGYSIDEMTASAALVQKLEPLEETLTTLLKLVQDARVRASGATWDTATLVYSMLKPVAARDGKVATAILPVKAFFATGKRGSKTKNADPATATKATTTPATETAATEAPAATVETVNPALAAAATTTHA
jgi:hypothetical protein